MEQKLKERVVGAAVLMTAVAIFIPMILSGSPEPDIPATTEAPAKPQESRSEGFSSRIVPLAEDTPITRAAEPEPVEPQAVEPEPTRKAPPKPVQKPPAKKPAAEARPAPRPPARTDPAPKKPATPAVARGKGWVVQLGSFANARNAHNLRDRLKQRGYAAFSISSGKGAQAVTRVYVGPEPDRAGAERHVAKLLDATRLQGIVVRDPRK